MLKVGITGGIGSGKSMVSKCFATIGIGIYDADSRAKFIIQNDTEVIKSIKTLLGNSAYIENNIYNRSYVAQKVFNQPDILQKLNQIVHPAVRNDFNLWVTTQTSPYILKEAAIMDRDAGLDKIIVVDSPLNLRISRIQKRDNRSLEQVEKIISQQKTSAEFLALADFIIRNNDHEFIVPQVLHIHQQLLRLI